MDAATLQILECHHVTKRFGGLEVLTDVSLDVSKGEIFGIIGPNGAGKTTLFNILTGLERPSGGRIVFRGRDITRASPQRICRLGITRTYQHPRPFPSLTLLENVMVGVAFGRERSPAREKHHEEAMSCLEFMGLAAKAGTVANDLTLAQKKRLEIARALATNPSVLLIDEAVGGLTPVETDELVRTVENIRSGGVTIILIEHVLRVVLELCDRVMVIHYGVKIAEGSPHDVIQSPRVVEAYTGQPPSDDIT